MDLLARIHAARRIRVSEHPDGYDFAVRYHPPESYLEGYEDAWIVDDDCIVTTQRTKVLNDFDEPEPGFGRLLFTFHLSGERSIAFEGHSTHTMTLPSAAIFYAHEGIDRFNVWRAGQTEEFVCVGMSPRRWMDCAKDVHPVLQDQLPTGRKSGPEVTWLQMPLTSEMHAAARSLLYPRIGKAFMREYITAKAKELVCLSLHEASQFASGDKDRNSDDAAKFAEAVDLIVANLRRIPPLEGVADAVGLSQSRLSRMFIDHMGTTFQDYCLTVRMSRAAQLLTSSPMPLKQIAYEVGYGHTSNMCIAFKRTFGITPTQARESGGVFEELREPSSLH